MRCLLSQLGLGVGLCMTALCLFSATGCEAEEPGRALEPQAVPAPDGLMVPSPGQVYRFIDPASGLVTTASSVEDIPKAALGEVLVFDAASPPPPGWEHVVDLSAQTPTTSVPTQGFVLRPSVAVSAPSAKAPKAKGAHQVVMFSTQGCGFCKKARAFFKKHGVAHSEYDVERDAKAAPKLQELATQAGVPVAQLQGGVPLIFINGSPHVGFDQAKISRLLGI